MQSKLYMCWLILRSTLAAVIVVNKNDRLVAHNMDAEEVRLAAKQLEETIPKKNE